MQALILPYLQTIFSEQRPNLMLWCPVFLGVGIALYFSLLSEPSIYVGLVSCLCVLSALWFFRHSAFIRVVIGFLLCMCLGFMAAQIRTNVVHTPILVKKMGPVNVEGTIVKLENLGLDQGQRIILGDAQIERLAPEDTPKRVRIKLRKDQDLKVGQRVELLAGLNPPAKPAIPGGFDFQKYMYFQSIGAIGFGYGGVEEIEDIGVSFEVFNVEGLRNHVSERILSQLGGAPGAVTSALMVGQRGAISDEDNEAMRGSGLAHMLAISGLHIGLFSGTVFFFVRLLLVALPGFALKYPAKKIAAVLAIMAAVFYMRIAGATIPTQRAALMTGIVFFAILIDRSPISLRLVAFAAFMILLIAPESLIGVSFQMSFAAVVGLVAFYDTTRMWWAEQHRQAGWVRRFGLYVLGILTTTVIATIATAPFALYHFQKLALLSVFSNIAAMPVLTFVVMPLSVLAYILMPLGLEGIVLPIIGWGVQAILDIAHFISGLEGAVYKIALWPKEAFLLFALAFIFVCLFRGIAKVFALPLMFLSFFFIYQFKQSFMLISSDINLVGYRVENSLYVSSLRKDKFTRGIWERSFGLEEGAALSFPKEGRVQDRQLSCGENGCRIQNGEHKISYIDTASFVSEECGWADVLIVQEPVQSEMRESCDAQIIDMFDARYKGPYAIYSDGDLRIDAVEDMRGARPWVVGAQKAFSDKSASD